MNSTLLPKSRFVATILFVFSFGNLSAQSLATFQWVKTSASGGADRAVDLKADAAGNLYTTGFFSSSSFTLGAFTLTPPSGTVGNFIAKQDAAGNYLWAKAVPKLSVSAINSWLVSLAVDDAGNVYTAGRFSGSITLGSTTLTAPGSASDYSVYVTKQDTDGNYLWSVMISDGPGASFAYNDGIFADAAGNVYLTGKFVGTLDFDPGPGTANLTGVTAHNAFIVKLDNLGNYSWAKALTNTTGVSTDLYGVFPEDITVDANGNVYTTGYITTNAANQFVDFDPGPGVYPLTTNAAVNTVHFINKLNASGDHVWSGVYGNFNGTAIASGIYINVDVNENVYATGWFNGTGDFDPGAGTAAMTATDADAFVVKLDISGNYVWARQIAGPGDSYFRGLDFDASGNMYAAGSFAGTADIDPGAGVVSFTAPAATNTFIAKWDDQGIYIDAQAFLNTASDIIFAWGLAVNSAGTAVSVAGQFNGTMDFNPGVGAALVTSNANDMYVINLAPFALPITLRYFNARPKGAAAELTWSTGSESNNKGFDILRSPDGSNWKSIGFVSSKAAGGNSAINLAYNFTDKAPLSGINYYRLKQEDFDGRTDLSRISSVTFNSGNSLSVYPNPAKGTLYLSGMSGGETVWIYNGTGQLLRSQKINSGGLNQLSLQGLANGFYHIKVSTQAGAAQTFRIAVE
jgi:hypothetical protein